MKIAIEIPDKIANYIEKWGNLEGSPGFWVISKSYSHAK